MADDLEARLVALVRADPGLMHVLTTVRDLRLPDWRLVLDEVAAAGYGGLELGPYGYMPLDAPRVGAELQARGLYIVAGTIFDDLVDPANRAALLRQTREICALITALPRPPRAPGQRFNAPYLTVMDWGHDERDFAAGHADRAPRLDDAAWAGMVANIREAMGPTPGARVLAIVGSSHKPYYERYLGVMSEVRLADVNKLLQ